MGYSEQKESWVHLLIVLGESSGGGEQGSLAMAPPELPMRRLGFKPNPPSCCTLTGQNKDQDAQQRREVILRELRVGVRGWQQNITIWGCLENSSYRFLDAVFPFPKINRNCLESPCAERLQKCPEQINRGRKPRLSSSSRSLLPGVAEDEDRAWNGFGEVKGREHGALSLRNGISGMVSSCRSHHVPPAVQHSALPKIPPALHHEPFD